MARSNVLTNAQLTVNSTSLLLMKVSIAYKKGGYLQLKVPSSQDAEGYLQPDSPRTDLRWQQGNAAI